MSAGVRQADGTLVAADSKNRRSPARSPALVPTTHTGSAPVTRPDTLLVLPRARAAMTSPGLGTIRLEVDGRPVEVPQGTTLLQAMHTLGVTVPTLCYSDRLPVAGACRVCMVEVEGQRLLQPACARAAEDGMKVHTGTAKAALSRRMVLELLMADHPNPCARAHLPEGCEVEAQARAAGIGSSRFPRTAEPRVPDRSNAAITFNDAACIRCYRCVRACDDVQVNEVIGVEGRGFGARIVFDHGLPMGESTCVTCGECVQACPTGALVERTVDALEAPVDLRKVRTVCPYCGVGCTLEAQAHGNTIVRVHGAADGPANLGRLCVKGRFGWDYTHSPERLTKPLIRREEVPRGPLAGRARNEVFREATWDEALALVAARLRALREAHGASALAGFSSAKCTNEENYLFQKFIRAALGSPHVDHCTRLCHASSVYALQTAIGTGSMTNGIPDIADADCMLITGSNTTENHPVLATFMKQNAKRGAKLIVVDPRRIPIARLATLHLQPTPGTDVALYNGMLRVIIKDRLYKEAWVAANTEGFEGLVSAVEPYTPAFVERVTGVPAAKMLEAARMYAQAGRSAIYWGMGISQHTTGSDNSFCLINLALLTGNIGIPGVGLNPLRGQNNVQGASDMGAIPMYYPGYQPADDPQVRARWGGLWGVADAPGRGLTVTEILKAAHRGEVKALYVMGENPVLSDPDMNKVDACVRSLAFLAVQDIFLTETAEYADVVLPAATGMEKDGTYVNTDRRVQFGHQVVRPPGDARQDWEILNDLCQRLGAPWHYHGIEAIYDEMRQLVPEYAGISHERSDREGTQWPAPTTQHPGTPIIERIPRGRGLLRPAAWLPPKELPDDSFPLVLNTGRVLEHWHTGTMTRRSRPLDTLSPEAFVELHSDDAGRLGIVDGRLVSVTSRRGEIRLKAKVSTRLRPGTVFIPFHFREAAANLLTIDAVDPYAKIPEFKFCAVRVAPA
jgi:formate dehydrogenase major subunit